MKQIIIDRVRRLIYRVAPSKMTAFQRYRYLSTEAKKISSQWQIDSSHRDRFDVIQKTSFATQQIAEEFTVLMERVKLLEPKQILEIGAFQGGTLSLRCGGRGIGIRRAAAGIEICRGGVSGSGV